jgi:hypothetical protein
VKAKATWKPMGGSAKKYRQAGHQKGVTGEAGTFRLPRQTMPHRKASGK